VNRARLVGISSVAIMALVAGACGSAQPSASSPSTTTTAPKLDLASAGRVSTPSADAEPAMMFPERATKYVLDAPLPDRGPSAVVHQMHAHPVSADDVQQFADALGLTSAPTRTPDGWSVRGTTSNLAILVSDGAVTVAYSTSTGEPFATGGSIGPAGGSTGSSGGSAGSGGGIATPEGTVVNGPVIRVAPPMPPAPPVDVPNALDAEKIARAVLDRAGVLAGQTWTTTVNDSGGVAVSCPVGAPCPAPPPYVSQRAVTFSPMVDGKPVDGLDWSVTIGEHRRIESVFGEWASPTLLGSYRLRSTAAVFADLQHGTARYTGPRPMTALATTPAGKAPTITTPAAVTVHVIGVSLGIAAWTAFDGGHVGTDLVPTYRFRARVDGGAAYDIVVLALDPGAATFTNPAPLPKPLPPQPAPSPPAEPGNPPALPVPVPDSAVSPPSS
jgi:hypothetical protein